MDTMQAEGLPKRIELNAPSAHERAAASARIAKARRRLELGAEQHEILQQWAGVEDTRRRTRSRIVLLSAQGLTPDEVGKSLSVAVPTVYKWLRRFVRTGLAGLDDLPRSGQPHRLAREMRQEIVRVTLEEAPPRGTRWTIRVLARHLGVTQHQVRQVWSDAGLSPHRALPQVEA